MEHVYLVHISHVRRLVLTVSCDMDGLHCYCNTGDVNSLMLQCCACKKYFHIECLRYPPQSTLVGDLFYKLTCERCSPDHTETCERMKMQWVQVIMLALYNLYISGASGKLGYFRWREHICAFIDRHWTSFFGESRKKTATFRGTVAGALSSGCPVFFRSGTAELKEPGWWSLTNMKPPAPADFEGINPLTAKYRKSKGNQPNEGLAIVEGSRRRNTTSIIQAAMNLKEKKSSMKSNALNVVQEEVVKAGPSLWDGKSVPIPPPIQDSAMTSDDFSWSSTTLEQDLLADDSFRQQLIGSNESLSDSSTFHEEAAAKQDPYVPVKIEPDKGGEEEDLDMDDFCVEESVCDPSYLKVESPKVDELVSDIFTSEVGATEEVAWEESSARSSPRAGKATVKEEPHSDSESCCSSAETSRAAASVLSAKKRMGEEQKQESVASEASVPERPRCVPMSIYEEQQLLKQLNKYAEVTKLPCEAQRLRRKLLVRQIKRTRNIPVFDFDLEAKRLCSGVSDEPEKKSTYSSTGGNRVLDRYQITTGTARIGVPTHTSFVTRILGLEEEQLDCIISPYTQRTLKPFIFRDYEIMPLRLKLLNEIVAHPWHKRWSDRSDEDGSGHRRHPVDFCYARPQHIPIVNAMCHTFFWPGIDLSESLQYPDFSCVVMYRKLVIGFAFMVPDVKYNEAYIPFIFTHPEWRQAGIGKFMIYHLIQTCMGKDVTLHVSATNPAVLLYQKFGFKVEELILDFYDKYFPADSKECKHAMFLRLSR